MNKISAKGVFFGGIIDIVSTNIFSIPLFFYLYKTLNLAHTPRDQIQAAIAAAIQSNILIFSVQVAIGIGSSILGGYLAARIAKHNEFINGALSAWLCVSFGIYAMISGESHASSLSQIANLIAAPVSGLVGGYLGFKLKGTK